MKPLTPIVGFQVDVVFVSMPGPGSGRHKKKLNAGRLCLDRDNKKKSVSSPFETETLYAVLVPLSPCERIAIKIKAWMSFANGTV